MDTNTLKDIAQPNRLPTQRLSVSPCFFAAPMGFPVPAGGHGRQKAASTHNPTARALKTPSTLPRTMPARPIAQPPLSAAGSSPLHHRPNTQNNRGRRGSAKSTSVLIRLACGRAPLPNLRRTHPIGLLADAGTQRDTHPMGRAESRPVLVPRCRRPFAPQRRQRPIRPQRVSFVRG